MSRRKPATQKPFRQGVRVIGELPKQKPNSNFRGYTRLADVIPLSPNGRSKIVGYCSDTDPDTIRYLTERKAA
jgi:hypothetical protein